MSAIGLMLKGTESCVTRPFVDSGTENTSTTVTGTDIDETEKNTNEGPVIKKEPVKKIKRKMLGGLFKDIFNED
jgi:hypothetical protein